MSPNRYWQDRRAENSDEEYACKRMRLEDVSFEDFAQIEGHWKQPAHKPESGISYTKIVNPIISEDPEELLINLLRNPYVDEICVCEGSEIILCRYARRITDKNIGVLVSALENVGAEVEALRIRLRKSPRQITQRGDRAVIYFSRVDRTFVAYKAIIPPEQNEVLRIETQTPNKIHLGICEPPPHLAHKLGAHGANLFH